MTNSTSTRIVFRRIDPEKEGRIGEEILAHCPSEPAAVVEQGPVSAPGLAPAKDRVSVPGGAAAPEAARTGQETAWKRRACCAK